MTNSTRIRFGALAAAAAVVAGGFLAAAPANAATGTITVANTTFTAGDWGTGLDVSGTGFTADAVVTVAVAVVPNGSTDTTLLGSKDVTADATGAFQLDDFVPAGALPLPGPDATVQVSAISDADDTANTVPLTVLAPKGLTTSVSTITTADLANKEVGFDIAGGGYTPGETVKISATYNGEVLDSTLEATAGADGSILLEHVYITGFVESGTLVITATGVDSGLAQTASISVVGETIVTDDGAPTVGGSTAPAATQTPAKRLPVVSG
ncbi:hypothetical protein [Leifsonia sp. C5G2]|uniref:hypothetical protein n=1 Tax=Leifsonia sp. C5G2 TaxID=2735269 RepID=UPI0015858064|nr:hypothetical protein [Leifsonia sp. C5G2]NUU07143.1 hypothetical protein [Leifsonia sp. C5G2]